MEVDVNKLVLKLKEEFEVDEFKEKIERYKALDLNPFDDGNFDDMQEVFKLTEEIVTDAIKVVEKVSHGLKDMSNGEKKQEAVVKFLDDIIKLPFFLDKKPMNLDGRLLKPLVSLLVSQLNKLFGNEWVTHLP